MRLSELMHQKSGEKVITDVDLCVLNDNLSIEDVNKLRSGKVFDSNKVVIVIDQVIPPNSPETSAVQRDLMTLSAEQNIKLYLGQGMTAEIIAANHVKRGQIIVANNSAIAGVGSAGALGVSVDEIQLEDIFKTGKMELTVPAFELIELEGKTAEDVSAKDVALTLVKNANNDKNANQVIILTGEAIEGYTLEDRIAVSVVLAQIGVTVVVENAVNLDVDKKSVVNTTAIERQIALEGGYNRIEKLSDLDEISVRVVFIGGTTGGSLEDIKIIADVVRGKKIAYGLRLSVAPATSDIYKKIADAGYIEDILDAGGMVHNQCADPEIQCRVGDGEVMVSNDWKNAAGYAGYETSKVLLASTKTAAEAALSGTIGKNKDLGTTDKPESVKENIVIEGRCWKFGDDIDTDIIIPTQWVCVPMEEMRKHAFEPLRPELAEKLQEGDIIVAGDNFGCGSSREMAAEVIAVNGVHCIIAKSFARIFFRNAINNGILLIECPELSEHVNEGDLVRVELNKKIRCNGHDYPIGKIHENIYEIVADGGVVKNIEKKVKRGLL